MCEVIRSGLGPGNFKNWPPSKFMFALMSNKIEKKCIAEKQKLNQKLELFQSYSSLNLSKSPSYWQTSCKSCPELPEPIYSARLLQKN